jgi:nitrogen fixation NifU-like protein
VATQLDQLYQQVILDHYKQKHGHGLRGPEQTPDRAAVPDGDLVWAESRQVNPLCGDEVTLRVAVDQAGLVRDVAWTGEGCSISQASTSVLTDLVIGRTVGDAFGTMDTFVELMQSRGKIEPDEDVLEDAVAFAGVAKYPARVKCALLGWMAFKDAVARVVDGDQA